MNENERLVWAAVYAWQWSEQLKRKGELGIPMSVAECIENAWAAVEEMRGARQEVLDGWGADDNVTRMVFQMLSNPISGQP